MRKIPFERWEYEQIELELGIKRVKRMSLLTEWTSVEGSIKVHYREQLAELREKLITNADAWNEDELKFFFISPLISLVNYETELYKPFTQRNLAATFPEKDLEVSGRVEFMIAQGKQHPRSPYFFLHEYKQEKRRDNDPLGQLLIAMLVSQHYNEKKIPLYGCYVIGRLWYFVVLADSQYDVSLAFDATQDDIFQIFSILEAVKGYIEKNL